MNRIKAECVVLCGEKKKNEKKKTQTTENYMENGESETGKRTAAEKK